MQPDIKNPATQTPEFAPAHSSTPQGMKMSAGWKIVFGILGGTLVLSIVSFAVLQVYYSLAELNGWSILETQWLTLVWLLTMAPAGLVALVGLAVAYPTYRAQRTKQLRRQEMTTPVGETSEPKEHKWGRWLVILGLISFVIPLLNSALMYIEPAYDLGYVMLAMLGISMVAGVVQLVFIVLGIIYILRSGATIVKKSIVGAAILGVILLTVVGIPALEGSYYEESDTTSDSDDSYYGEDSEYYNDEYAQ